MSVAGAFIKRDFSQAISYRFSFMLQIGGVFFSVAIFYFLSELFGGAIAPQLEAYGGNYFSFVLIGLAFTGFLGLSLSSFATSIREGQVMGTLEIMLLSPTRLSTILICSSLWGYVMMIFRVVLYLVVGAFIFGADLGGANIGGALLIMLLSIASFTGFGVLSAALVLIVKKGDPVAIMLNGASSLLAGVFYPVAVLPDWLEPVSKVLPLTYALDSMRLAMLQGKSIYELRYDILVLLAFTLVLTPLSFLVFRRALKKAKMEGSLIQY
ncbi:MAG TPA: ABC transporter permease [Dehalococcoidia bacterium]|nr:ABC transporter permease [Dehalococcoidia bacterium]